MYKVRGNQIYYVHPELKTEELFITVHPTKDSTIDHWQQAALLADVLNKKVQFS
jgi:hypothetical protein